MDYATHLQWREDNDREMTYPELLDFCDECDRRIEAHARRTNNLDMLRRVEQMKLQAAKARREYEGRH
jgi:hypothetical protein